MASHVKPRIGLSDHVRAFKSLPRVLELPFREQLLACRDLLVESGADVRYVCHLDPKRFQRFVAKLSDLAGFEVHLDDADADSLRTIDDAVRFLVNESSRITLLGLHHAG